jgi:hypothetical protein
MMEQFHHLAILWQSVQTADKLWLFIAAIEITVFILREQNIDLYGANLHWRVKARVF